MWVTPLIVRPLILLAAVQGFADFQRSHVTNILDSDVTMYVQDKERSQAIKPSII